MNIKSLAAKLKALAERGEPHERELAQKKLDALLAKYDLDESDFDEEEAYYDFRFSQPWEQELLMQIGYKVLGTSTSYGRKRFKLVIFCCTKAQALEIEYLYSFYRELFQDELNLFLFAFVQKHRLFKETEYAEESGLSREDDMRWLKMMGVLQDKSPLKALDITE